MMWLSVAFSAGMIVGSVIACATSTVKDHHRRRAMPWDPRHKAQ